MRSSYPGYFRPTPEEFKTLWDTCHFVFDTSVLLNVYEYSQDTTENLKKLMTAMKDRLWLPHHVGWEFVKERRTVIDKQKKPYEENMEKLKDVMNKISVKDSHPFLSPSCLQTLKAAIESVQKEFDRAKQELEDCHENDKHLRFLEDLYKGRIGPPYTGQVKADTEKEGQKRYEAKIPPGYMDKKPKEAITDNRCGDYIIWCQMKDHAKSEKTPIVFITDDGKDDTWLKHNDKTIGPRPEMIEEFLSDAGQQFYMHSVSSFLKLGSEHFNVPVNQSTINEAKTLQQKKEEEVLAKVTEMYQARLADLETIRNAKMEWFMPIVLSPDACSKINRRLQTPYNTMAGTFEILRDGRRVAARLFRSEKEIMDFIGQQEPGDYLVYEHITSNDKGEGLYSEEWGKVTHRQDGSVERQPFPPEDQ